MTTDSLIREAILNRQQIEFYYDGHFRKVIPAAYGLNKKDNPVLRAYQVGGFSKRGAVPGWRMFTVAKMSELFLSSDLFSETPVGYRENDSYIPTIYAQL